MMNSVKTYKRKILSTGKIERCKFNESHAREAYQTFNEAYFFDEQKGLTPIGALRLVNKWNHSASYHYWIDEQM